MTRKELIEYGEKMLMLTDGKMQNYIAATCGTKDKKEPRFCKECGAEMTEGKNGN